MNTISELIKKSIDEHWDKTALIDNGLLSYGELYHYASCIARQLEKSGVKKGNMVGIKLARSKEYIVAVVSCLLYGYCAVLIDVEYPQERIDFMIKDSSAVKVIDGDFYDEAVNENEEAEFGPVTADANAIVVYTSGSTGNPKGVLHDQNSAYNAMMRLFNLLDYRDTDVYGSNFPYTFISIGADVLYPLCVGATIDVVPRNVVKNADTLAEYICSHGITATNMPPKILKVFRKKGDSLRISATGSEKVSGVGPDQFRIVNLYGMSEGFPSICAFELDKPYDTTPIGRGDGSLGIYLLDDDGNEAEEGEICVTGHLFSGYINLDELTKKVLVPNPFKDKDGHDVMFHTNDIGKLLPDGNIMYVNRKDWMVKINGYRVEPGEIECAVKSLPQVFDCVVKAFTRNNGSAYLAAYYVEKSPVSADSIRKILTEKFPYYMIPTYYVRLEALPVNNNGKLDHKALLAPETAEISANYIAPKTDMEKALCKTMAAILQVKKVGMKDDFFFLGGSYEDVKELIKEFASYGLTEKIIYKYKTPEMICSALENNDDGDIEDENRLSLSVLQPITRAQQYYLDYQLYAPSSKIINNSSHISIPIETIDASSLKTLLESTFLKHPALSSKIVFSEDGELAMQYFEGKFVPVECFTCTESEFNSNIINSWRRPLPALNRLLYYCIVYTTESNHHVLFDIHRSICDLQGIVNLFKSIQMEYEGKPTLKDYYYVYLSRTDAEKKKYFDVDRIKQIDEFLDNDICGLALKKDRDSRKIKKDLLIFESSKNACDYEEAAKDHQTPIEHLLIASAMLATGRCNSSDTVAVNWMYNGRDEQWKKDIVGLMTSAVPVSARLTDYNSIIDLLKSIRIQCNTCIEYSEELAFLHSNPGIMDLLQIEYLDNKELLPKKIGGYFEFELDENNGNSAQLRLLAVKKSGDKPIEFLLYYNSACYSKKSIEDFAALLTDAFDICSFGKLKDWL